MAPRCWHCALAAASRGSVGRREPPPPQCAGLRQGCATSPRAGSRPTAPLPPFLPSWDSVIFLRPDTPPRLLPSGVAAGPARTAAPHDTPCTTTPRPGPGQTDQVGQFEELEVGTSAPPPPPSFLPRRCCPEAILGWGAPRRAATVPALTFRRPGGPEARPCRRRRGPLCGESAAVLAGRATLAGRPTGMAVPPGAVWGGGCVSSERALRPPLPGYLPLAPPCPTRPRLSFSLNLSPSVRGYGPSSWTSGGSTRSAAVCVWVTTALAENVKKIQPGKEISDEVLVTSAKHDRQWGVKPITQGCNNF